jgi:hypothetical protein
LNALRINIENVKCYLSARWMDKKEGNKGGRGRKKKKRREERKKKRRNIHPVIYIIEKEDF